MKLKDLVNSYSKAEAVQTSKRATLGTTTHKVLSSGTTESGYPYVMIEGGIKVLVDGEYKMVDKVVLFREDMDIIVGQTHDNFNIGMLNAVKCKVDIDVVGYENEAGEIGTTHRTRLVIADKELDKLYERCNKIAVRSQGVINDDRPF